MRINARQIVVGNILKLEVELPEAALDRALAVPGQSPVEGLHITLIRIDDLGLSAEQTNVLPLPKQQILLDGVTRLVDSGLKQSCYIKVCDESSKALRQYAKECAIALGLNESAVEEDRVFHVTLSNAGGGHPRSSIGSPWRFQHTIV